MRVGDVKNFLVCLVLASAVVAALEVDWIAVSDDSLFTPALPIVDGGRVWTFADDRTAPLLASRSFKGLGGPDDPDKLDLGIGVNKMNFMHVIAGV